MCELIMIFRIIIFTSYLFLCNCTKCYEITYIHSASKIFTALAYFIIASYNIKTHLNSKVHKYTFLYRIYSSIVLANIHKKKSCKLLSLIQFLFFKLNISLIRHLVHFLLDEQITILNYVMCHYLK